MTRITVFVVCVLMLTIGTAGMVLNGSNEKDLMRSESDEPITTRVDPYANLNFDGEIDLEDSSQVTVIGKNGGSPQGDYLGYSVMMGDLNNDSYDELIISAPNAEVNITAEPDEFGNGEVYIYFGRPRVQFNSTFDIRKNPPDVQINGTGLNERLGDRIVVEDINDDGYNDLLLGCPNYGGVLGRIYIFLGRNLSSWDRYYNSGSADIIFTGSGGNGVPKTRLAASLSCGDIDGDGINDIVAGAPGWDRLWIWFGNKDHTQISISKYELIKTYAFIDMKDTQFGDVMTVGDINNDGYAEIIAASGMYKGWDNETTRVGQMIYFSGRTRAQWLASTNFYDQRNLTIYGQEEADNFGDDLALGDFNGDGFNDIYVSAPGGDGWKNTIPECGEVYVVHGSDNRFEGFGINGLHNPYIELNISQVKDLTIYGASQGDRCGASGYMGDVDQDGFSDLQFCAFSADGPDENKEDCGETYLLFGGDDHTDKWYNISDKEVDLIIYGATREDRLGSDITSGDIDQDGFIDIMVSSAIANGPLEMRKNCGEVYILFATGFRTKEFGLIGGYDPGTRAESGGEICFADHRDYSFYVTISDSLGTQDLNDVELILEPETENIKITWDEETGSFSETNDPKDLITLNTESSMTETDDNNITIFFDIKFDWDYPSDAFQDVKVVVKNDSAYSVQSSYLNVFTVENDLDIFGTPEVESSVVGDLNVNGSFCPQKGIVNWTGLRVVYQDTIDIYPPDNTFDVKIRNGLDEWFDNTSFGEDIFISTDPPHPTNDSFGVKYDFEIVSLLGNAEDVSDVWHYLRTDSTPPPAPTGLKVFPDDMQGPPGELDDDTSVFLVWDPLEDVTSDSGSMDGVGVKRYFVSTQDGSGTTNGQEAWESGGLWGDYYNSDNFYDLTFTKLDPEMDIDWGYWSPHDQLLPKENFSVRWRGQIEMLQTGTYTFYIEADDGAKVWIDGKLIWDEWRLGRPSQSLHYFDSGTYDIRIEFRDKLNTAKFKMEWSYGTQERQIIPWDNLLHPAEWAEVDGLVQGENTIYVWAEDRYGNIGPASSINVTIDSIGPYFTDAVMSDGWYTKHDIDVGVKVNDDIAGPSDDIQYTVSTSGLDDYEPWEDVAFGILDWDNQNNSVSFDFRKTFKEGSKNYVKFRAKDQLGNGYNVSNDYQIKIDTTPLNVHWNSPENNTLHYQEDVEFNISFDDLGGSGIDISSIKYRYSTNGTKDYSQWFDLTQEELDISGSGTYVTASKVLKLPEGTKNWVQFKANDIAGTGTIFSKAYHVSVDIPVVNLRPIAVISRPINNASYIRGSPITFDASNSTDDGLKQPLTYQWTSSWDGELGKDKVLKYTRPLYIGEHIITLKVYDGQYNVTTKIRINILDEPDPEDPVNPEVIDPLNDTDGDGMLDSWEEEFFGGIDVSDGTEDTDGDGYSDKLEYLYDTDPKDKDATPPKVVPKDADDKDTSTSSTWMIVILLSILLVIIIIVAYMYLKKQQEKQNAKGDAIMAVRSKTKDDLDEDGRIIDDEYDVKIEKKSKKQRSKEAKKLYGKTKKGRKKRKMKHDHDEPQGSSTRQRRRRKDEDFFDDDDEIIMPGENEPEEDPFGEKEFDMDSFEDDELDGDMFLEDEEDGFDNDPDEPFEEDDEPFEEDDEPFEEEEDPFEEDEWDEEADWEEEDDWEDD